MAAQDETKNARNFRSLKVTLIIAFLATCLIVLLISSSMDAFLNLQIQESVLAEQQQLIADNAAVTVKNFVQEKFRILEVTASMGIQRNDSESGQYVFMEKLLGVEPSFRQIVLLGPQKEELAKSSRLSMTNTLKITDAEKDEVISIASQGKKYIGPVYIDKTTSEPMMIISIPVDDFLGNFRGALLAEVNLKFMWDMVGRIKNGDNGLAYVVDRNGRLIAFADTARVLKGEDMAYLAEVREFIDGDTLAHKSSAGLVEGINGIEVVTNHAHLVIPDWAVVVELPADEAYGPVTQSLITSFLTLLLGICIAVFASLYLSGRITKPIVMLRDAAIDVGAGKLDRTIDVRSNNEIGELASSFNAMISELRISNEERKKHTQELEASVQERTKALNQKLSELTDTKTAVLNMMEDMERANSELVVTKGRLEESFGKLREVDIKKDEFISIAAHELKTPLTSIHGFSQLLRDNKISADAEKRGKYLGIIENESMRLAKLVNEILDLSRVDLGTIRFVFEEIDVNELMEAVKKEMEIPVKNKGLSLEFCVQKSLPRVTTDRERLTQVLINLITNSVKYTEKGKITVSVSRDGGDIRFSVKDTGIGVAKENHPKMFQRFYQVDSSYTRKAGGTGLGLSLCKEFVTRLGGRIWFESAIGKGSEFFFTLPLKLPEAAAQMERDSKEKAASQKESRGKKPDARGAPGAGDAKGEKEEKKEAPEASAKSEKAAKATAKMVKAKPEEKKPAGKK